MRGVDVVVDVTLTLNEHRGIMRLKTSRDLVWRARMQNSQEVCMLLGTTAAVDADELTGVAAA
jgi:hypothetical protein